MTKGSRNYRDGLYVDFHRDMTRQAGISREISRRAGLSFAAFAGEWKEETSGRGTFVPLAFVPGEAFEFDWSEDWSISAGERTKLQVAQVSCPTAAPSHCKPTFCRPTRCCSTPTTMPTGCWAACRGGV